MQQWIQIFYGIAFIQGILLALAMFLRKKNSAPNKILSIIIFLLSFEIIKSYLILNDGYINNIIVLSTIETFSFFIGPLLLLYTALLTSIYDKWHKKYFFHFAPATVYFLITLSFLFSDPSEQQKLVENFFSGKASLSVIISESMIYITTGIYLMWSIILVRKYNKKIKTYLSNVSKLNLLWLRVFLTFIIAVWIMGSLAFLLHWIVPSYSRTVEQIFNLLVALFIYILGYWTISLPEIYSTIHNIGIAWKKNKNTDNRLSNNNHRKEDHTNKTKYIKSSLNEVTINEQLKKITDTIEQEKLHREPELTINDLSSKTTIPSHHISQIINSRLGLNFFNFINSYRVEEAKKALRDEKQKNESILSIAYQVGFNSKSTFNAIFKKFTSFTPTQYRNMHNLE